MYITWQSLGREETRALVQAMESGVKEVRLSDGVTLDMETLERDSAGVWRLGVIEGPHKKQRRVESVGQVQENAEELG